MSPDPSGRLNGRGAYLCRNVDCLTLAIKRRAFDRALGGPLPPDCFTLLESEMQASAVDISPELVG